MVLGKTGIQRGLLAAAAFAGFLTLGANPGWAAHGMGGGGNMGGGAGMMGAHAGGGATFGGQSSNHINAQGSLNTNGPNATDRDFGRDRAEDRTNMNANVSGDRSRGDVLRTSTNAGGSATANTHRWRHGRHHHYGWRAR
jgi:hypothetical protein